MHGVVYILAVLEFSLKTLQQGKSLHGANCRRESQ
jgi:hypothetical protein